MLFFCFLYLFFHVCPFCPTSLFLASVCLVSLPRFFCAKLWQPWQMPSTRSLKAPYLGGSFSEAFRKYCIFGYSKQLPAKFRGVLPPLGHHPFWHEKRLREATDTPRYDKKNIGSDGTNTKKAWKVPEIQSIILMLNFKK